MADRPYITYAGKGRGAEAQKIGAVVSRNYVDEPGQVSFGVIDYVPGWFITLHHHFTWELIIIDSSSTGPGYTFFEGQWWRAEPGSAVFIPNGCPHAWSSGNDQGFKMLWIYGGAHQEASRVYDADTETFQAISQQEEKNALIWTDEAVQRPG